MQQQHAFHSESYHHPLNFSNGTQFEHHISIHNLDIHINSLINITINNQIHLNYFTDTNWNEVQQQTLVHQTTSAQTKRRRLRMTARYAVSPVSLTFSEAHRYCNQHHGSMASIMSPRDNIAAQKECPWHCWIGLQEVNGKPMVYKHWSNGRRIQYKNWHPGEPNNDARQGRDCGEIYAESRGLWNDIPCAWKRYALCEQGKGQVYGMYIAVQIPKTFVDAETWCLTRYGTHLATIHTFWDNQNAKDACNKIG
eukprot:204093_1